MAKNLGESEGFEVDKKAQVKMERTPDEIEESIQSTPTVTWDPFAVLPKEIYWEIFNHLDNPADKQNFMNAHVKFYELFEAERVKFLFGKVFGDLSLDEKGSRTDKNLIGIRLVCRDWDEAIQNYYQPHPDHFEFAFCEDDWMNDSNHLKQQYAKGYQIRWDYFHPRYDAPFDPVGFMPVGRDLGTDLDQFQASHPSSKNPFLTRKITIEINSSEYAPSEDEALRTLWTQLDALLDTYGHHIWHFHFGLRRWGHWKLKPEMYSRLLQWLRLMPELKTLQMQFTYATPDYTERNEPEIFRDILRNETPELRKLRNLQISGFPCFVFNKILEESKAMEKVEVVSPQLLGFKFPKCLTETALKFCGPEDIKYLNTLEQFPVLQKLSINLESLDVASDLDYLNGSFSTWNAIFMAIEEKFPALEDLHFSLPMAIGDNIKFKMMEQSLDCRLNLRKLRRLSLTFPTLSSLDFLQEMKGLQELKIRLNFLQNKNFIGLDDLVRRERIQFNRDLGTMWESNIWQEFPNLRKLSIRTYFGWNKTEIHSYEKGAKGEQMYNKIINI